MRKRRRRGPAGRLQGLQLLRPRPCSPRLAVPYLPNNPPRWPEVVQAIRKILIKYAEGANKWRARR